MRRTIRLIGYWQGPLVPDGWPDVREFVSESPSVELRRAVATYLRSGTAFVVAAGFSACRFCGIRNGSAELTDGEHFVWPQGLAHYVESHDVWLPEEVVTVARRGPAPPVDPLGFGLAQLETGEVEVDYKWWQSVHQF